MAECSCMSPNLGVVLDLCAQKYLHGGSFKLFLQRRLPPSESSSSIAEEPQEPGSHGACLAFFFSFLIFLSSPGDIFFFHCF